MNDTPSPPLASARAKLAWARILSSELKDGYRDYFASQPFTIEPRVESATGKVEFAIQIHDHDQIMILGLRAADVLHNARTALDHAVFDLARRHSPHSSESGLFGVYFPIVAEEGKWQNSAGRLRLVSDEAKAATRDLQIFAEGGGSEVSFAREGLFRLHQLDRADRHRWVNLALFGSGNIREPEIPGVEFLEGSLNYGVVPTDGSAFATWRFSAPVEEDDINRLDLRSLLPIALCYSDISIANPGPLMVVTIDLIHTVEHCLNSVGVALDRLGELA